MDTTTGHRRAACGAALILALTAALGGCGDGGGGLASTPAPTPTPTPTPSPVATPNADLVLPLNTETFSGNAASLSVTFSTASNPVSTPIRPAAGASDGTIGYDAATQGWSVRFPSRGSSSQETFTPADQISSTAETTSYRKTSFRLDNRLVLTNPGSAGHLRYTYVAAAIFENVLSSTSVFDHVIDAFAFGTATANSAVPRTGAAAYDIDLFGTYAGGLAPNSPDLRGTGQLTFDLGGGRLSGAGSATLVGSLTRDFKISGTLGSTNAFSGTFTFDPAGTAPLTGPLDGRFYGPSAQEVGAAAYANSSNPAVPGGLAVAVIGRRNTVSDLVGTPKASVGQTLSDRSLSGAAIPFGPVAQCSGCIPGFTYNAASGTYGVTWTPTATGASPVTNTYTMTDSAAGRDDFISFAHVDPTNPAYTDRLDLFKPGSMNSRIALSYTTFAVQTVGDGTHFLQQAWMVSGAAPTTVPTSGSASYSGIVEGQYSATGAGQNYAISGTSTLNANFAAGTVNAGLAFTGTNLAAGGPSLASQTFSGAGVLGGGAPAQFAGTMGGMGLPGSVNFRGSLVGPNAEEFGLTFDYAGATAQFAGVAVGKQ